MFGIVIQEPNEYSDWQGVMMPPGPKATRAKRVSRIIKNILNAGHCVSFLQQYDFENDEI
jgi:hypothetical protein